MSEIDVESRLLGGTEDDQKKFGTYKEHFYRLREQFRALMVAGAANPITFENMFYAVLSGLENKRLHAERRIKELERKLEWCRAEQHAASQDIAMLEAIVRNQVQTAKGGVEMPPNEPTDRPTDKEVLATICICGCQDEEDASNCDCKCHTACFCEDERCAVCPGIKAAKEAEEKPPKRKRLTKKSGPQPKAKKKANR